MLGSPEQMPENFRLVLAICGISQHSDGSMTEDHPLIKNLGTLQ